MLDLLLTGATLFDVTRSRTYAGWLGIKAGRFQYVEEGEVPAGLEAVETRDLGGCRVTPGLIDAHMHIESSLLTPRRFAEAVLPHGTTTVMTDPHELANVLGVDGVTYTLEASEGLPLRVYVAVPSCVPATSAELETALGKIDAGDVSRLAAHPRVLALGEVMDYQGLAAGVTALPSLITAAQHAGLLVEGHTPTLGGTVLSDYTAYGVLSDHTLSTPQKLLEQLTKGYTVMLQEKSLNAEVVRAVLELAGPLPGAARHGRRDAQPPSGRPPLPAGQPGCRSGLAAGRRRRGGESASGHVPGPAARGFARAGPGRRLLRAGGRRRLPGR